MRLIGDRARIKRSPALRAKLLNGVTRQARNPLVVSKEIRHKAWYYNRLWVMIRRKYVGYATKMYRSGSPEFEVFVKLALKFHALEDEAKVVINVPHYIRQHFDFYGRACYPSHLLGPASHFFYTQYEVFANSAVIRPTREERVEHEKILLVELSLRWGKSPADMFDVMHSVFPFLESMSGNKRQTVFRRATIQVAQATRREPRAYSHKQVR